MPSFRYNDFLTFRRHRVQATSSSSSPDDQMTNDQANQSSSMVKHRRATLISIPPTLINISNQEILSHIRVHPTLFYYNEETFQEVCYRTIEDIRKINRDECLWIDVTGVRFECLQSTTTTTHLTFGFRCTITIFWFVWVNTSTCIRWSSPISKRPNNEQNSTFSKMRCFLSAK